MGHPRPLAKLYGAYQLNTRGDLSLQVKLSELKLRIYLLMPMASCGHEETQLHPFPWPEEYEVKEHYGV